MSKTMPLYQDIETTYEKLKSKLKNISKEESALKKILFTGGPISVADLIAYQIGWGKLLIGWYESGLKNEIPQMPGDGFDKWNYKEIAKHFFQKYQYDGCTQQDLKFQEIVTEILFIVKKEFETGNLDKVGVWEWCTLKSGKNWPLSKWIQINTSSPYKRAVSLI